MGRVRCQYYDKCRRAGNLSVVATLLSTCAPQSAVPEERDEEDPALHELSKVMVGERALMQAINGGFKEVVIYLLNNGVSINNPLPWRFFDLDQDHSQDSILTIPRLVEMGCFALHLAIAHKDQAMVRLLLEADADPDLGIYYFEKEGYVNCKWLEWKSPLAHACALGNNGIAQDLLEYGANIESQYTSCTTWKELNFRYSTPLIQAARSGHVPTMELLLEAGADANNYGYARVTPLAAAAAGDHVDAATLLLQKGVKFKDESGQGLVPLVSPIVEAVKSGSKLMLRLVLDAGIDVNVSILSKMPLAIAVSEGLLDIVDLLIEYGCDVNGDEQARKIHGWPSLPLCRAIRADNVPMVELLLRRGADHLCTAGWGRSETTPLNEALGLNTLPAAVIVIEHDKQLNTLASQEMDAQSETPGSDGEVELDDMVTSQETTAGAGFLDLIVSKTWRL
jgi:ankyrin repeat protein